MRNFAAQLHHYDIKVVDGGDKNMFCGCCGSKIPEGAVFCPICGEKAAEMQSERKENDTDIDRKGSNTGNKVWIVINTMAWLLVCMNIIVVALSKSSKFMSLIHTYYRSLNGYVLFYYGFVLAVIVMALISIFSNVANNKSMTVLSVIADISFGILILIIKLINNSLQNSFMNSVSKMMLYTVTGVYGNNIWKISYLCLFISFAISFLKVNAGKRNTKEIKCFVKGAETK